MPISIRPVASTEVESLVPALVDLIREVIAGGASLGYLAPPSHDEGRDYWGSLRPELETGRRLLLAAFDGDRLVGSGQLVLPTLPNSTHRAELQKLFVANGLQGQGIGALLVAALHDAARARGRWLVLLNARQGGGAERFYKRLGYREVGVIPGYSLSPAGKPNDHVTLYQHLSGQQPEPTA